MPGLAEKFQITVPFSEKKDDDGNQWASFESQRITGDNPQPGPGNKFNRLPQTEIEANAPRENFVQGFGGNTDVTAQDGSGINDPKTFREGFARREMKATDDQYSGEHIDQFYGLAVDEKGQEGFAERNNYLDRL